MHYQTSLYSSTERLIDILIDESKDHENVTSADYEAVLADALRDECEDHTVDDHDNHTFAGIDLEGNVWTVELWS